MEKTYFCKVEGMTCGNCALTISRFLEKKGMKHISANAASGELNFTTVQDTDVDRIYKGINELGYKVIKPGEEEDHAHQGHHHHGSPQLKRMLAICIIFTAPLLLHMFAGHNSILNNPWLQLALCIPPYSIGLYHFGTSAYRSLKNGIPNMDVLIIMGATAAFVYSVTGMLLYTRDAHQYLFFETTATIITFVLAGNYIEERTSNATTSAIKALAQLQPSRARLVMTDSIGKESIMEIESKYLKLNDVVLVNDGDSIPVDGVVLSGTADVNESMITGESMPVTKEPGDTVTGGAVITAGNMRIRATAVGEATALSEIIRLVQKAQGAKPPMQKLADKISAVFVPAVLGIAILSFLVNYFIADVAFAQSMMRSIAVVVIACPCAMGLATPAAVAVGLGRAARNGILIKGGDTLEQFKDIRQIVFDKTGTLTTGKLAIKSFETSGISEQEFKAVVTGLEQFSAHPIAKSLLRQWSDATPLPLKDITETKGLGIRAADHEGNKWELGSYRLLEKGLHANPLLDLHLLKNGQWVGGISMQDELREDAVATIGTLHRDGFQTVLLSGDHQIKVEEVSGMLGIDKVMFQQTPAQKMEHLEQLIKAGPTLMVGDGINDAPALAKADIGVSLSDATKVAMQSAQVILSGNKLSSLSKAIKLGRFTYQTIRQNLFWAFFYNILAIPLAAMGYLSPIWAAAVMAFSDVILVLNSLRLNYRKID
jgi:Cu+-exporting ATPase